jgi:hypothetical protein
MAAPLSGEYFSEKPRTLAGSRGLYQLYAELWSERAKRRALPLPFNPLEPNQALLFAGREGQGLSWVVNAWRQQHLENGSAVLEFDWFYVKPSWSFQPAVETAGRDAQLVVVNPGLPPARYDDTLLNAINSRSCLHWEMPDVPRGTDWKNPVLERLAAVLEEILRSHPPCHNRLLIILQDAGWDPHGQVERIVRLAKLAGASIWVTTKHIDDAFQEAQPVRSLFDSSFLFGQMDEKARLLAAELCQIAAEKEVAWQAAIDAQTFVRLRAGRFIWLSQEGMQVGQMALPRPIAKS